jgi:opacity protein-like surface antigen
MKLRVLGLGCLLAMGTAQAGYYAGATFGFQTNINPGDGNYYKHINETGLDVYATNASLTEAESHGAMGSLFLGYALNDLIHAGPVNGWLGLEFNAELTNQIIRQISRGYIESLSSINTYFLTVGENQITQQGALGITAHPGLSFANQLKIYGIVGYEAGYFKSLTTLYLQAFSPRVTLTPAANHRAYASQSNWLNGVRYGLGVSYPLTPRFDVRAEFNQTDYGRVRLSNTDPSGDVLDTPFHPSSRTTSLGLVWKFDAPVHAAYQK